MKITVIPDVHGTHHWEEAKASKDDRIVFMGDYVDSWDNRQPDQMDGVLYAEPTLQGNAVMARRQEGQAETQLNLELLFNAVAKQRI